MGRKFARKLLIIAVVLSVLVSIYDFISVSGPNYWVLMRIILPTLLLSVSLKYPTMAFSSILAGMGAFSSVAVLSMYLLRLLERLNKSKYDSNLEDDKEFFQKYVLPILDAIKHRNPDVLIEEPKELVN